VFRCNKIASDWNYSVELGGVGSPPDSWTQVGHCSQYAVFRRLQQPHTHESDTSSASFIYEQVCQV